MDINNLYKILLPREVVRAVNQTSKDIDPKVMQQDIDPKVMQQLYQQMLQDINRPITNIELDDTTSQLKTKNNMVSDFQDKEDAALTEEQIKNRDRILKDLEERRDTKKSDSVDDTNYLQEGKTETKNVKKDVKEDVEEKDTDATTNLLTDDYYNTQYGIETFKNFYDIHNPLSPKGQKTKPRQKEWNKKTLKKWQTTKVTPMVTNTIDAIFPAFKNELERHGIYSRDFGTKLAITESAAGTNLIGYKNGKPVDFGMFQINAKNLNKIFNTDAFENSFKKYWGPNAVKAVGNISADQLKEMYNNDPQKFLERITNDHKLNLAIALAGVIVPNLDAKKIKKQSGGMIESDPYKKQPRFI